MMKFWKHVESKLNNLHKSKYHFIGSTLVLELSNCRTIALNINGIALIYNDLHVLKDPTAYQPKEITELVTKIYTLRNELI